MEGKAKGSLLMLINRSSSFLESSVMQSKDVTQTLVRCLPDVSAKERFARYASGFAVSGPLTA